MPINSARTKDFPAKISFRNVQTLAATKNFFVTFGKKFLATKNPRSIERGNFFGLNY